MSGAGDVNGDGFDDLIIGARSADPNGNGQAGESYVVFGGRNFAASVELNHPNSQFTNVTENSPNGTFIALLKTEDVDQGDTHTYTLIDDAGGRFAIDQNNQLVVANGSLLDFETNTSHNIVVRTTDSGNLSFDQTLTINVNNDDGAVSIDDVTVTEGDNGTTNAVFTVTFSEPVNNTITVDYSTADGTATVADNDYVPISPTPLVFNPNQTTQQITVEVNGDNLRENDETFFVNLTNLQANGSGITLGDDQGVGTINDDDNSAPTRPQFGTRDRDTIEVGSNELVFAGAGDDLIDSSAGGGGNRIYGQSGDDTFILGSNDRGFGGSGDDRFFMLGGNSTITGGAGDDQFSIAVGQIPNSANVVTDFTSGEDVLGIAGLGIGFSDLSITQVNADTLISLGNDELATLLGVNSLSPADFVFA